MKFVCTLIALNMGESRSENRFFLPSQDRPMNKRKKIYALLCFLVMINLFVYFVISDFMGGNAINGKIENGHYYLWGYSVTKGSKDFTEVSKLVFYYSESHFFVTYLSCAIMFTLLIFFLKKITHAQNRR
jgi:hypothetical protein